MTSVWKRLQRVGKKAAKFHFAAAYRELLLECTHKWQPDKLRVVWIRRNRRHSTKLHSWQPGIQNPYRGLVVWQVLESTDIDVTLFKETKGRRKVLASADVNMKKYASATQAQFDLTLKLKPLLKPRPSPLWGGQALLSGGVGGEEEREEEEEGKCPGAEPIAAVEEGPHWPSAEEESSQCVT
ncbi:hypothetical protein CRUP_028175 [Coryphaenoides rupestris]|nr:hypothetical protein CRUP_028175 [Coryphaenoides rupestris]